MGKATSFSMVSRISAITRLAAAGLSSGYEFPDVFKVDRGFRVKIVVLVHRWAARHASLLAFNRALTSAPPTGFTLPLFRSS